MHKFMRAWLARPVSPFLMSVADDDASGSDNPPAEEEQRNDNDEVKGFPEGTALDDMTVEQRAAYWRHEAKKQERIAKETKADLKKVSDDLESTRRQNLSDEERAIEKAKDEGRAEAEASAHAASLKTFATYELRLRGMSGTDAAEMVELLDLSKLTNADGAIDGDRLDSLVAQRNNGTSGGFKMPGHGYPPPGKPKVAVTSVAARKRAAELAGKPL